MKYQHIGQSILWLAALAACLCFSGWRLINNPTALSTNLFDLLPATTHSELQQEALSRSRALYARQLIMLVSHSDSTSATEGARIVHQQALQAGLTNNRDTMSSAHLLAQFRAAPFNLLTRDDIAALRKAPVAHFSASVQARLRSPFQANITDIARDPGGYLSRYILSLPRPYPAFYPLGNTLLAAQSNGMQHRLLALKLPDSGFSQEGQSIASNALEAAENALAKACPDCVLRATGPALFAISARNQAQQETSLLGLAGTLSLIIMLLFVFHSIRPLLYTLTSVAAGVVGALTAVLAINGSIHILTLVFGTTLLGIGVDYAFHYLVAYWQRSPKSDDGKPTAILPLIFPGLTLGLLTSLIAFSFLFFSGFPALRQIALFSCAGLTTAYLTVVLGFPAWLRKSTRPISQRKVHYLSLPSAWRPGNKIRLFAFALGIGIMGVGLPQLTADDDVRNLQPLSPAQLAEDAEIRTISGQQTQPGFFLIQGANYQEVLQREEQLRKTLTAAAPETELLGLSRFIPSIQQQKMSQQLWHSLLSENAEGWDILRHYGFSEQALETLNKTWTKSKNQFLTVEEINSKLAFFKLGTKKEPALTALIQGQVAKEALYSAAKSVPGVSYFDPLHAIAQSFEQSRVRAAWLVAGAYLMVLLVLIYRYGIAGGIKTLSAPVLALGVTLGLIGLFGASLNIFSVMALIMVLGIGLDYILFLREGAGHMQSTGVAVTLAAFTSLLSFVFLSFSSIPALHTFGITVTLGMLLMYLAAPLALPFNSTDEDDS